MLKKFFKKIQLRRIHLRLKVKIIEKKQVITFIFKYKFLLIVALHTIRIRRLEKYLKEVPSVCIVLHSLNYLNKKNKKKKPFKFN